MLKIFRFKPLVLAALVLLSCSGASEEGGEAEQATTPEPFAQRGEDANADGEPRVVIVDDPLWPINRGQSVSDLIMALDVIVGRVTAVAVPYDPRPGYLAKTFEAGPSLPPSDPKAGRTPSPDELSRVPGRLFTVFAVEVLHGGTSSLSAGAVINVGQSGGMWGGTVYQDQGNPLLQVGTTYLLGIRRSSTIEQLVGGPGYFLGVPFAQFVVDAASRLQPLDPMWAYLPAVGTLSGLSLEDALARIQAALPKNP